MPAPDLAIPEAAARLRDGRLTARDLAEAHLARIAALDPALHAFVARRRRGGARRRPTPPTARSPRATTAARSTASRSRVKDLVDVAGLPTACGSRRPAPTRARPTPRSSPACAAPAPSSSASSRPTNTPPSARPSTGPRRRRSIPGTPSTITGGSSSGSAAAVAAGLLRTVARHRHRRLDPQPRRLVRRRRPEADARPRRRRRRLPALPDARRRRPAQRHASPRPPSPSTPSPTHGPARPGQRRARPRHRRPAARLRPRLVRRRPGARCRASSTSSTPPWRTSACSAPASPRCRCPTMRPIETAGGVILDAEAFAIHRDSARRGPRRLRPRRPRQPACAGPTTTEADLAAARRAAAGARRKLDARPRPAPRDRHRDEPRRPRRPSRPIATALAGWTPMRTLPFNVTGHPALSVPAGFVDGLPVGLQIIGPAGSEALICRIGARVREGDRPCRAAPAGRPCRFSGRSTRTRRRWRCPDCRTRACPPRCPRRLRRWHGSQ